MQERARTLTWHEVAGQDASISLTGLFNGLFAPVEGDWCLEDAVRAICRGGWPELRDAAEDVAARWQDDFLRERFAAIPDEGGHDGASCQAVALAIARAAGAPITHRQLGATCFPRLMPASSAQKAAGCIEVLQDCGLLEPVCGWDAPVRAKTRVRVKPLRHFADPSLHACLLGLSSGELLADEAMLRALFREQCIHDLLAYVRAMPAELGARLWYYRDSDGVSVDAIIELADGRWAAIGVTLGEDDASERLDAIDRLCGKVAAAQQAAQDAQPAPLAFCLVLTAAGSRAYYDRDRDSVIAPLATISL